jgi:hypothetical protein
VWARPDRKIVVLDPTLELEDANAFATSLKLEGFAWDWH